MLSQQDVKNIIDQVIGYSKLPECEVYVNWTEDDFIRFANNGITTSGYRIEWREAGGRASRYFTS
jgi:hypothetical protein